MPPRRSARGHGASERSLSYLLLLLAQQVYKLEHKPPVTILLVIGALQGPLPRFALRRFRCGCFCCGP